MTGYIPTGHSVFCIHRPIALYYDQVNAPLVEENHLHHMELEARGPDIFNGVAHCTLVYFRVVPLHKHWNHIFWELMARVFAS